MPLSGQLCGTADGRVSHVSRFPVAFRLPALASWPSVARWGIGPSLRSAYRTPLLESGPQRGFHVPHVRVAAGVGALYTPGTVVLTRPTNSPRPPPAASQRHCPCTPVLLPSSEAPSNEASLRVYCIHPPGLPRPVAPGRNRHPWALPPELQTPPLLATHVRVGTGIEHWPGATPSTSFVDPPFCEPTRNVRLRVARVEDGSRLPSALASWSLGQSDRIFWSVMMKSAALILPKIEVPCPSTPPPRSSPIGSPS